ncbi:MAG: type I restriction enzyme HsdR N-terminal domain-containing protein [Bacteroidales bacterium]|nr:type I restriction enzyme HsdR N-terminal domain-containing protein [Bacteroidales bacterium]
MAIKLNLPDYQFNIKKTEKGALVIFDVLRQRFITLTPEEWVRQNFVQFLIQEKEFPQALMGNEVSLTQNGIKRRCDTLVADACGSPFVIVEYKAPSIQITQQVFDQIVRYNMVMRAKYLIVSNGLQHYCCRIDYEQNSYEFLDHIPNYANL